MIKVEEIKIDPEQFKTEPDCNNLELIATRNLVLFPEVTVQFEVGREYAQQLVKRAEHAAFPIGIVCQKNPEEESPAVTTGLYRYGVFADVLAVHEEPGHTPVAIVRARGRFRILGSGTDARRGALVARVHPLKEYPCKDQNTFATIVGMLRTKALEIIQASGDPQNIGSDIKNDRDPAHMINTLATNIPFENADKIELLGKPNIEDRGLELISQLNIFIDRISITEKIAEKARRSMDENQRNAFLQSQMEAIRETLYGDEDNEVDILIQTAESVGMPRSVLETFRKEAEKMRRFNPSSPDYGILYTYLETLTKLPWNARTETQRSLADAKKTLESQHYGLEKVKERILEQIAVLIHNPDYRGSIICLVGPPGVGKTSIGRSIAEAMDRQYQRVSFGGLHDESEIRGHRRTYIGAMPGRIIEAYKRAAVLNPVIVLDEIDKIGQDYKGDPAAALLEVLDPEQNRHFHDNYIDVDFPLNETVFIATANSLSNIPRPLLDRMEIIEISGYLAEEKIEIARRHLIPKILRGLDLRSDEVLISDEALQAIITDYTAESGVRELEKRLTALIRKYVLYSLEKNPAREFPRPVRPEHLYDLLGLAPRISEKYEGNDIPGVVTGLAWTEVGGEILMAEACLAPAKEGSVTMTGNLGNVMKESATIAYQWIKTNAEAIGVDREVLNSNQVHVHFPEGAIPKDGPSAGITIVTAIVSALRKKCPAPRIAMTGEISLRGRVLPVGGIREKILAAKRAGITDIIMSVRNRRDIEDMPYAYRDGLTFHYVDTIPEVLAIALPE